MASSALMEKGAIRANAASYVAVPRLSNHHRHAWASASGIRMYITTDSNNVSHGTLIDDTPSSSATKGAKATTIIRSFRATCVKVKLGSPSVKLLHTNTIAVQGAAASRIRPAM